MSGTQNPAVITLFIISICAGGAVTLAYKRRWVRWPLYKDGPPPPKAGIAIAVLTIAVCLIITRRRNRRLK